MTESYILSTKVLSLMLMDGIYFSNDTRFILQCHFTISKEIYLHHTHTAVIAQVQEQLAVIKSSHNAPMLSFLHSSNGSQRKKTSYTISEAHVGKYIHIIFKMVLSTCIWIRVDKCLPIYVYICIYQNTHISIVDVPTLFLCYTIPRAATVLLLWNRHAWHWCSYYIWYNKQV